MKGIASLSVVLVLFRCVPIVLGRPIRINQYRILAAHSRDTFNVVKTKKDSLMNRHKINENQITQAKRKWNFGVSDCWNYTSAENERLSDNYVRLRVLKHYAKVLNVPFDVVVEVANLQRAIVKRMGRNRGNASKNSVESRVNKRLSVSKHDKQLIQATFLSILEKNLFFMSNDFKLRSLKKA